MATRPTSYGANVKITFYTEHDASVDFAHQVSREGEVYFAASYAARQLAVLGNDPSAFALAIYLRSLVDLSDEACETGVPTDVRLTSVPPFPGARRFYAALDIDGASYRFDFRTEGFGLMARGMGYYSPASVQVLLNYLIQERPGDRSFRAALLRALAMVAARHLVGTLTLRNQNSVAIEAGDCAIRDMEYFYAHAVDGEDVDDLCNDDYDDYLDSYYEDIVALLEDAGKRMSAEEWTDYLRASEPLDRAQVTPVVDEVMGIIVGISLGNCLTELLAASAVSSTCIESKVARLVEAGYCVGLKLLEKAPARAWEDAEGLDAPSFDRVYEELAIVPERLITLGGEELEEALNKLCDLVADEDLRVAPGERESSREILRGQLLQGFYLAIAEYAAGTRKST